MAGRKKAEKQIASSKVKTLADLDRPIRYFRTDVFQMNDYFGGVPRNTMIHAGAKEGVGKTTVFAQAGVSALKYIPKEEKIAFVDFEGRLNLRMIRFMCAYYGVDESRFLYTKPTSGQDGLRTMEEMFQDKSIVMIIADSLKTVISEKAIEKNIGENAPAMAGPKLVNEFLEKHINVYPEHLTLVWIDHLKATATAGSFYSSNDTKSGASVKFLSSLRIFLGKDAKGKIVDEDKVNGIIETIGHHIYMDVRKTTVCPMVKVKNMVMINGRGISSTAYLFNKAVEYGFVIKKAAITDKKILKEMKAKKEVPHKAGLYYVLSGETKGEIFIGRTKAEKQAWMEEFKTTLLQEINDRVYEEGQIIFRKKMTEGYTYYASEFNIKGEK